MDCDREPHRKAEESRREPVCQRGAQTGEYTYGQNIYQHNVEERAWNQGRFLEHDDEPKKDRYFRQSQSERKWGAQQMF